MDEWENFASKAAAGPVPLEHPTQETWRFDPEPSEARTRVMQNLAAQVSKVLAQYMIRESIGFNELERRLQMSSATVAKLLRGQSNITLDTIAALALVLEQEPRLLFVPLERPELPEKAKI